MTPVDAGRIVCAEMAAMVRWLRRLRWLRLSASESLPVELVFLRVIGFSWLVIVIVGTVLTAPQPRASSRGALIVVSLIVLVGGAVATQPQRRDLGTPRLLTAIAAVTAGAAGLCLLQRHGVWQAGPVFVAIIAAMKFDRRPGLAVVGATLGLFAVLTIADGRGGEALSLLGTAIPWYLVMRLLRVFALQRDALAESRAAEGRAAAAAERGRLAREMHDVLAHSLSALALQLESTRLLARSHGADPDVVQAVDRAHHLAASGLQEARQAIATARGEELPGPERIGDLADAFGEQSGLPVAVEVQGAPRALPPEAGLAVYRTAQEALTNVRRHATAARVDVRLQYRPDATVLVVEDHAVAGAPPPVGLGLSGGGFGLTGMRERAELLGGELLAAPTAGGFRVELRLPVDG